MIQIFHSGSGSWKINLFAHHRVDIIIKEEAMDLIIAPKLWERFPSFLAGVLIIHRAENSSKREGIKDLFHLVEESVKQEFPTTETISQHPHIAAWRSAYRAFGCDPTKYRCSSEALVRQVLKGNELMGINTLVDLYNYISLKYIVPVGGEDLDKVEGDIMLDLATGQEEFIRLGGTENDPPEVGEVVYKDDTGVLCRRWNWREGERTKITENTKKAIIVIDALAPMTRETVQQAMEELTVLIKRFCSAEASMKILDGMDNTITL